jgi:glycosyltransferase involved in cell wall biosynthesis
LTVTAAKPPTIAFVIPCYNEQAGIQHTLTCLLGDINKLKKAKAISPNSYVLLVDDGSTDRTWDLIKKISNAQPKRVRALKLSRNVGHSVGRFARTDRKSRCGDLSRCRPAG